MGLFCPGRSVQQPTTLRISAEIKVVMKDVGFHGTFKSYLQSIEIHKLLLRTDLEGVHSFIGLAAHIPTKGVSELMPLQRLTHEDGFHV